MNRTNKIIYLLSNREKYLVCLILILSILNMILDVFSIGILIPLFANLTDQIKFDNEFFNLILSFLEYEIFKQTSSVVLIIILIFLFKNLIILLLKWFENELTYGFLRKNSKNLLNFYINKNYLFHLNNNSSELIKNIQGECNIVSFNILRPFLSIISLLISVITILILLIGINAKITIVTILFFSIIGIIFSSFTKKILKKLGKDRNKYSGLLLKSLQQTFSSIREIIISNKKVFFLNHFDNSNAKVLQSGIKSNFIYSIPRSIIEISLVLLIGAIIIYLDTSKILFTEIILTLTTFLVGASRLMPGISNIFSNISVLIYNLNSLNIFSEDFFNFLKTNKKDQNKKQISFKKLQFKNANFRYPGRTKKIISNLNLDLKFNDKIGIIGDTGSGKSTLINILTGLLKLNKGEILIDGLKIKSFNRDWYNIISYVPQNILTLDENLKDNITLGEKKINSNYLNKIYKILNLNEVKKRYSNSSTIGERGSKISGGQNQRIGLARAFYKKSKILILDEALNSIDVRLRDKILDSIFEIYKDKLVILVSHQIDALKKFNIILKVEDGKIVRIRKK